jgi:sulfate/thiosulfate transport system substrate-binding protein
MLHWLHYLRKLLATDKVLEAAKRRASLYLILVLALVVASLLYFRPFRQPTKLVNVAYDASKIYFERIDAAYAEHSSNRTSTIVTSNAGSIKQTQALAEGFVAEIVCLASSHDLDTIAQRTGCVDPNWRDRFPYGSSPFTSTVVLVVEKGNPLEIKDWSSLTRKNIEVLIPSPKASGAGVYAFLTILKDAIDRNHGDESVANRELLDFYLRAHLPEMGAYHLSQKFIREKEADVLVTWESEAIRIKDHWSPELYEIVYPSFGLLAEPVVNLLDCHVDERGNRQVAVEYIQFLFSQTGQEIAASAGLRPRLALVADAYTHIFPSLELIPIQSAFDNWQELHAKHFGPQGTFEKILLMRNARKGGIE